MGRPMGLIPPRHGIPQLRCLPEGFPLHVLICDAVVHQGLIPHGVTGVAQRLRPQLIGLQHQNKTWHNYTPDLLPTEILAPGRVQIRCSITSGSQEVV